MCMIFTWFHCCKGIVAQELSGRLSGMYDNKYSSYIAASYVKFVEGAGGRVVPIWWVIVAAFERSSVGYLISYCTRSQIPSLNVIGKASVQRRNSVDGDIQIFWYGDLFLYRAPRIVVKFRVSDWVWIVHFPLLPSVTRRINFRRELSNSPVIIRELIFP